VAAAALAEDPAFGPWVERIGPVRIPRRDDPPYSYLARAICHQQLAGAAARTIHGRFVDALDGDVRPETVLAAPEADLRSAGLSAAKLAAVRDLAEKARSGEVPLDDLEARSDEDVVERLVRVRGIGVWTAQMFLLFRLRRADVWPTGDLGVRQGYARIHGLDEPPKPKELELLGRRLRPWRSAAAWYCYRALESD
jgi:3-methyladenine DNA glycosylase/8-oxoguanine DNA glycosylase